MATLVLVFTMIKKQYGIYHRYRHRRNFVSENEIFMIISPPIRQKHKANH